MLPEHVDKAVIHLVAHWWNFPRPLIPNLRRKFDLTPKEAIDALRAASDEIMRSRQ